MNKQEEWRDLYQRSQVKNYKNGMYKKNEYSKEEIKEKREYYESKIPNEKFNIPYWRWMYEIKRHFDLNKDFEEYPDASFARLEFVLKFGL